MRPTPRLSALSTAACLLALTACGGSEDSGADKPTLPPVPTGVTAHTSSSTTVHVMWNRSDADKVRRYEVYRNGEKVETVPGKRHMVDIEGLKPSSAYTFSVRARDAEGNLSKPGEAERVTTPSAAEDDSEAPTAPTGLKARADGPHSATLTWGASTDNKKVTSYDIYQAGTRIHSVDGASTTASVTTLRPETRYTFTVRARDAADNASKDSPSARVTTEAGADDSGSEVPTDLQATVRHAKDGHHLELTWNAPSVDGEVTEYEIHVDGKFRSKLTLGESAPKSTANFGLPVGKSAKTYAVKVRGKLLDGNWGGFSKEIKVSTGEAGDGDGGGSSDHAH
ncbi:fibronectin type III domain-containing protein [Streptomyces sp. XM4193]|uniref:fibronectin type III domain-containing protein n=1 Tax=Streptomyces sp. XM4193 TaxID=2929782 RepID=UPI001FFB2FE8|nr:fibronectin type III domain-containing protein [Streptomyces sp. XM4193]MCK1798044.1 fibronectin type III domain-containing protein [Streptomyces sp. XM4193]